jgi:hypothetical protein
MQPWFGSPGISLMKRKYDAAAFWAHLAETGTNPYDVFPFVFLTGDGPSAYRGSGAEANEHFLNSWASSITLKEDFGRDWEMMAPGMPDVPAGPELWQVDNDSSVEIHAEPYAARVFFLDVSADMMEISGTGHARISDGRVDTFLFPTRFCINTDGCDKPEPGPDCNGNQPPPVEEVMPAPLGANSWFVVTGGATGSTFTVVGRRLDDRGDQEPCPTPEPTPNEFCTRYMAYWAWASSQGDDVTRAKAAEIDARFRDMRPYAPVELVGYVDLMINIYHTFATAPDPIQVPLTGQQGMEQIPTALRAMHQYCGMPAPF